jgi:hypothetical protein
MTQYQIEGKLKLRLRRRSKAHVATRPARNPVINAYISALLLMLPLILIYIAVAVIEADAHFNEMVNSIGPLYLIAVLLTGVYRILSKYPSLIWTPVVWLPLQSALFFGFGPLVQVFGNEATLVSLSAHKLVITQSELIRVNTLTTIGIWFVLAGFCTYVLAKHKSWTKAFRTPTTTEKPTVPVNLVALGFVVVGATIKYIFIKPSAWGMSDLVVPGVLSVLGNIADVGFGLMLFVSIRGDKRMRTLFTLLWPIHLFLCVLSLSKLEVTLALVLPAIAAYVAHRRVWRLGASFFAVAIVFAFLQPYVQYGRAVVYSKTGTISEASYKERAEIIGHYIFDDNAILGREGDEQDWWTRLNYTGTQAYAMKAYDNGRPGDSLKDAWMLFIPRVVWWDKPIMVGPGAKFYSLVTGRPNAKSFLAVSVYGDLYWQFGWWGIVLVCPLIGCFFAIVSLRSFKVIHSSEFILFPAVLIGLEVSILGLNKYLVNGIIASIPLYVAYLVLMNLFVRFLRSGKSAGHRLSFNERGL